MSTGLVQGMGLRAAADAVAQKAAEVLAANPSAPAAIWTEVGQSSVLVGYAVPGACCAISIDRAEYDGLRVMEILESKWKSS